MPDFILPETRYALSGDVNIAYQVMGAGPVDVIMAPGVVSHVEFLHEMPRIHRIFAPSFRIHPCRHF